MNKILLFSGTSEGRELSEFLSENKLFNQVYVATEYGQIVMKENEYSSIHSGRMDIEEMALLFEREKPDWIVDATHPYAVEVTANIKAAAQRAGFSKAYMRVSREISDSVDFSTEENIYRVFSAEEAIALLKKTDGPIMLTTGVKELGKYAQVPELKDRIFARILPGKESMEQAYSYELLPRQLIAMEGPFSREMNIALLKQYGIRVLVTKNSGDRGGFREKLLACKDTGTMAVVIDRATADEGCSLEKAKSILVPRKPKVRASVVGIGMGNSESITLKASQIIKEADFLIGAKRMVEFGQGLNPEAEIIEEYKASLVEEHINRIHKENPYAKIAVLVSGDVSFFSLGAGLSVDYDLYPGISSFSYLASRIHKPYSYSQIISFHGRASDKEDYILTCESCYCIVSGLSEAESLIALNQEYKGFIGYNLGQEDELIVEFAKGIVPSKLKEGLYILYLEKE